MDVPEKQSLMAAGHGGPNTPSAIAESLVALYMGETSVKTHVTTILRTVGLRDRIKAAVLAYE